MNYYHHHSSYIINYAYCKTLLFNGIPDITQLFMHYSAVSMRNFNIGHFTGLCLKFTT